MKLDRSAVKVWPVRVRFPQPDGRGVIPRKWSVDHGAGALRYVAERLQKVAIQHGWPVDYRITPGAFGKPERIEFRLRTGPATARFRAVLADLVAIEARRLRARVRCDGCSVWLVGPHWLQVCIRHSGGKVMKVPILRQGGPSVRPLDDPPW